MCIYSFTSPMRVMGLQVGEIKQFYEIYRDDEFVSPVVSQISWTNHLLIMSKTKTKEERDFYVTLVAREHYFFRELL